MRRFITIAVFLLMAATMHSQLLVKVRAFAEEVPQLENSLSKNIDDTKRLDILLQLAAYHLYKMDQGAAENSDLETAAAYISKIKELNSRQSPGKQDGLPALYESTFNRKRGDTATAKLLANQAVSQLDTRDNGYCLALSYVELSRCYDSRNPAQATSITNVYNTLFKDISKRLTRVQLDTLSFDLLTFYIAKMRGDDGDTKIDYLNHLVTCFKMLNDKANEFWTRKEIGDIHYHQGKMIEAINELQALAKEQKDANELRLCWTYDLLSGLYGAIHIYDKALYYSLETLKSVKTHEDSSGLNPFYGRVAGNYSATGSTAEAIQWNLKRLNQLLAINRTYGAYGLISRITSDMIKLDRGAEALDMILEKDKNIEPVGNGEKQYRLLTLAKCYSAVNNNVMAEKYCKEVIALNEARIKLQELTNDPEVDGFLASFYFKLRQYDKAEVFFRRVVDNNTNKNDNRYENSFRFKLDSARGNYLSAIKHLQTYHRALDSIFTVTKTRQVEELKIAYATDQKDSLIKLNEQNIGLLTKQDELQKSELRQGVLLRNISLAVAALLIIIVSLLFNRYRLKQRTNRKLELQQLEIAKQNLSLQHLVSEKEWLLKEIHHRVKNNLQIVMSLLNSQSAYIDNEPALTAIHDSQHRVHAMSLIHQKLYNTENVSSIDISAYIRELASYLSESFDNGRRIRFEFNIEPFEMDVSQAIPLGLILNESITNSIKYAFPGDRNGLITISLVQTTPDHYLLSISDNGVGMPPHFDTKKKGSLGMSLMKGLSEDIDGNFSIENKNGTTIKVSFIHDVSVKKPGTFVASFVTNN